MTSFYKTEPILAYSSSLLKFDTFKLLRGITHQLKIVESYNSQVFHTFTILTVT